MNRYWNEFFSSNHYLQLVRKLREHESIRKFMLATDAVGFGDVTEVTVSQVNDTESDFFQNTFQAVEMTSQEPVQIHFRKNVEKELPMERTQMASMMLSSSYLH